ncbi:MAG: hypothetical protein ABH886_06725 [Candidatus Desantisbacteria bacterium]
MGNKSTTINNSGDYILADLQPQKMDINLIQHKRLNMFRQVV